MSVYYIYMLYIHFMIRNVHLIYTQCTPHNIISLFMTNDDYSARTHTHMEFKYQGKNTNFDHSFFRSWNTHSRQIIKKIRMHAHTHIFFTFSIQVKPNGKIADKKTVQRIFQFNIPYLYRSEKWWWCCVDCKKNIVDSPVVICCLYLWVCLCCMETSFSHSLHSCM